MGPFVWILSFKTANSSDKPDKIHEWLIRKMCIFFLNLKYVKPFD